MTRGPKAKKPSELKTQRKTDAFRTSDHPGKVKKNAGSKKQPSRSTGPTSNPFTEIQNKRRSNINLLGKKVKGQKRNVQKSRIQQASERTTKILDELRSSGRTSTFNDKRIGDKGDYDGSALRRLEKERKKKAKRSFALNDEVLTHGGKALSDDTLKLDVDDHELDAQAEREAMVMLQADDYGDAKTKEERYQEIIAKSKTRREELFRDKEAHERERNALNANFQDLMQEVQFRSNKTDADAKVSEDKEYDKMTRSLAFERKALASDRLKTPEEQLKEKAEKLAKLEQERVDRMSGIDKSAKIAEGAEDEEKEEEDEEKEEEEEEEEGEDNEDKADTSDNESTGSESVDLDVSIDMPKNNSAPAVPISLPEKSYPSFYRPPVDLDPMSNGENESHLPFTVETPTSIDAFVKLEKYGLEHLAKLVLRARVGARQMAAKMVTPLLDYLIKTMKSKGFAVLYALEPVLLGFVSDFRKDLFAYFEAKVNSMNVEEPTLEYLVIAKIAGHLFPSTDLWHPILTPILMLLDRWAISNVENRTALVLFSLLVEYTLPARRYSPGIFVLAQRINCPQVRRIMEEITASYDVSPMGLGEVKSLRPLRLHYRAPAQVEMLDPVFHDPADGPVPKGDPTRNEELRLRRKLNEERRAAGRHLRRDQQFLQVHQTHVIEKSQRAQQNERKRVRRIMDEEDKDIKKLAMQHSGMDTSLRPSSRKKRRKENPRLGGNKTKE